MEIRLIQKNSIDVILPLLSEADPLIPSEVLEARFNDMVNNGYECAGIYQNQDLVGICGIWTLYKYYVGKHIEPDNVYIKPEFRNSGIGSKLVAWLKEFAISRECNAIELNCYLQNNQGREYWVKNGFKELGMHYQFKMGA